MPMLQYGSRLDHPWIPNPFVRMVRSTLASKIPMSAPAVSVLLTTYNRESFLASAIESVLCPDLQDFELLIVDDGSTDRTVEIARAYERLDSRVRVVVNERNLGQFRNRNRAAELARGRCSSTTTRTI